MRRTLWIAVGCGTVVLGAVLVREPRSGGGGAAVEAASPHASRPWKDRFVVHEWGTFLSVAGSDGVAVGGMIESEEELPDFVESRANPLSLRRALFRQKMETPVTYFYTDRPLTVNVRVEMPDGLLTHWWPVVAAFGPPQGKDGGSFLDWGKVHLVPPPAGSAKRDERGLDDPLIRPVPPGHPWAFARHTDAALVDLPSGTPPAQRGEPMARDREKFLFYRGLGRFDLPLSVTSRTSGSDSVVLDLRNRGEHELGGVVALRVTAEGLALWSLGSIAAGESETFEVSPPEPELPLEEGVRKARQVVAEILVHAGLYEAEARSMVDTWEQSYFRSEGLRVLHVLPRETVDRVIPLAIDPLPDEVVRVMLARLEVLTPAKEAEVARWVRGLADEGVDPRRAAVVAARKFGRFTEPYLYRVAQLEKDETVRSTAQALASQLPAIGPEAR